MVKKGAKKSSKTSAKKKTAFRKKVSKKIEVPVEKTDNTQRMLVENFVGLQGVMTDLSSKLNNLTEKVSKLLDLFEDSAKALTEKGALSQLGEGSKEVSEKLDRLLDQNKVLAQGVALLHETNSDQNQSPESEDGIDNLPGMQAPRPTQHPQPMMRNQYPQQTPTQPGEQGYQKSISSKY